MKIGISCNRFGKGGGFERYALDLVRGMLARGQAPVVFARRFDADVPEYARVERHLVPVRWLPGKMRDMAFSLGMRHAHRHCDVLIGCNRVVGADLAVCGGTHRGYLRAMGRHPEFWDRRQIELESRHYAQSRRVVAHSRMMTDELLSLYGLPADKVTLLYPPVDTARFVPLDHARRQALRARLGFDARPVFLFPSSDHARKGLDVLAQGLAASGLDAMLAVAGRPIGKAMPGVRELGYCGNMAELYCAADFTVLASRYEPFGLVGIESVLCGTPVLMAEGIGCLEVLDHQAARRFPRDDVAAIAGALREAAQWAGTGAARLATPRRHIAYDPDPATHLDALLALAGADVAAPKP